MINIFARCLIFLFALLPAVSAAEPIKLKLSFFSSDRALLYKGGVKPFVEYGTDRRKHDQQLNCFCENRDSDGRYYKAGLQFELNRWLTGEFSAGTLTREYKDPNLETLRGTLIDASLIYYATPLTTLKFDAKTTVAESAIQGVSGTLTRDLTLTVDHSFRRWLIGTLKFGYSTDDYIGLGRDDHVALRDGSGRSGGRCRLGGCKGCREEEGGEGQEPFHYPRLSGARPKLTRGPRLAKVSLARPKAPNAIAALANPGPPH